MVRDCGFTWVDSNVSVQGLEMKRLFKFLNLLNYQFKSFIYILRHYQTCKNVTRYCTEVTLNYNKICKCTLGINLIQARDKPYTGKGETLYIQG